MQYNAEREVWECEFKIPAKLAPVYFSFVLYYAGNRVMALRYSI